MPCYRPAPNVFVCHARPRHPQAKPCRHCGKPSTRRCDYPLTGPKEGQTCDAALCDRCAHHVGEDRDYCAGHAKMLAREAR